MCCPLGQMLFRVAVLMYLSDLNSYTSAEQVPRYVYRECYSDKGWLHGRALRGHFAVSNSSTLAWCTLQCLNQNEGFTMMGVEYGNECYCGSEADVPTRYGLCSSADNDCECDHPCPGNNKQICGGDWAISIYYISWEDVTTISSTAQTNSVIPTTETLTASISTPATEITITSRATLRSSATTPQESSPNVMTTNQQISVSHNITNHSATTTKSSANVNRGQQDNDGGGDSDDSDIPVIAGGTASGVVIIILSVCLIVYLIKKKKHKPDTEQNGELQSMSSVGPDTDTYTGLDLSAVDTSQTYTPLHLPDKITRETQQEAQSTYETLQSDADDYYNIKTYAALATAHTSTFFDSDNYENTNEYVNK